MLKLKPLGKKLTNSDINRVIVHKTQFNTVNLGWLREYNNEKGVALVSYLDRDTSDEYIIPNKIMAMEKTPKEIPFDELYIKMSWSK